MSKLICELCGSEDIVKEGEMFVCKGCGCKYTFEQAKKMIGAPSEKEMQKSSAEGNLYVLARRALESKDYKKTEEYYSQILLSNPNDWEATFYSVLAGARVYAKKYPDGAACKLYESITPVYRLIKNAFSDKKEQSEKLSEVVASLNLYVDNYYDNVNTKEIYHINRRSLYIRDLLWDCGDNIVNTFGYDREFKELALKVWKRGVVVSTQLLNYLLEYPVNFSRMTSGNCDKESHFAKIKEYSDKIKQSDPTYIPPQVKKPKQGCYVATCVYGSYDCAEVWTLRRYRDNMLATTRGGRAFIKFYYAVSPKIVKLFGNKNWFRKMWKKKLDKKVAKLQAQGVENTPYEDKEW